MHGPLRAPPAPRRRGPSDQDAGFTLIELLVVVVILGILAAIAVPTYTSMRRRAWDAATKSELRNAAVAVESYVNANAGRYPSDGYSGPPNYTGCNGELCTELTLSAPFRWENGGFLDYNPVTPAGYCIMASHQSQLSRIWALHSSTGVPVLAQCDAAGNLV